MSPAAVHIEQLLEVATGSKLKASFLALLSRIYMKLAYGGYITSLTCPLHVYTARCTTGPDVTIDVTEGLQVDATQRNSIDNRCRDSHLYDLVEAHS